MGKKKMDEEKKIKLIYSGELIFFSVVFLVLGFLKVFNVLGNSDTFHSIFHWVTLFGGTWVIVDLAWALASKKRRKRISLLDKCLTVPLGIFLVIFDIISLINANLWGIAYSYLFAIPFFYLSVIYAFEGVYHYYNPIPGLLDDLNKEKEKEAIKEQENTNIDNDQDSSN